MTESERIEEWFEQRGVRYNGLLLLPPNAALELLDAALRSQIRILGVSAFVDRDGYWQARPELLEFGSAQSDVDTWNKAQQFVREVAPNATHFEVSLSRWADTPKWKRTVGRVFDVLSGFEMAFVGVLVVFLVVALFVETCT